MEIKNIISTQETGRMWISYDNLIHHFDQISLDKNFDYFSLFEKKKSYIIININRFRDKFKYNSYSFLDIMFLFVASCKARAINIFNFLVSNHEHYEQNSARKYKINSYNSISNDNVIESRQFFVLGVLSLFEDYFAICDKDKEKQNTNEQLIVDLFRDIFLDDYKLIDTFKKINKVVYNSYKSMKYKINNILKAYNKEIDQINEVKDKILSYYEVLSNEYSDQKNRITHFVNSCNNKLVGMDMDIIGTKEQNQFYNYPNSAFKEVDKMNYQVIYQDLNNASEEFDIVNYKSITPFLKK